MVGCRESCAVRQQEQHTHTCRGGAFDASSETAVTAVPLPYYGIPLVQ